MEEKQVMDPILENRDWEEPYIEIAKRWFNENLRGNPEKVRQFIDKKLWEIEAKGDIRGRAWFRFYKAWLYLNIHDHAKAYPLFDAVLADFEAVGDLEGFSRTLNALALSNSSQGLYDLAIDRYRESMRMAIEMDRSDIASAAGFNLVRCLLQCNEEKEALEVLRHCRQHFQVASHNVISLHHLEGETYRKLGMFEDAERTLLEGIRLAEGSPRKTLDVYAQLAETYLARNRLTCAEEVISKTLPDAETFGHWRAWTDLTLAQARLFVLQKEPQDAILSAKAAIKQAQKLEIPQEEADGEHLLYQAYLLSKDYEKALVAFEGYSRKKEALRNEQITRRIAGLNSERLRRDTEHFKKLYNQISKISEIGKHIASRLDLDASFDMICSCIGDLMNVSVVLIALVDEEQQCLDFRYTLDQGKRLSPIRKGLDEPSFASWCVKNRKDIVIGDLESEYSHYVSGEDRLSFEKKPEMSLIYIPLLSGKKVVGVLSVQSHHRFAYDPPRVEMLRAVGGYIAVLIENSRLFKEVQLLASRDALTGLSNRRCLMEELERAYRVAKRYNQIFGVVMCDIDHFKQINDTYGHDVGDIAICSVADALLSSIRESDMVGRYGGEEFVILLPETELEDTLLLAERLRKTVEQLNIFIPEGNNLCLTASFGVSINSPEDLDYHSVLKRTDNALYEAKFKGRNRVCHY